MTPQLWGDQEAFSEERIPEDDLKGEQGLARKGRQGVGKRGTYLEVAGGSSGEPQGYSLCDRERTRVTAGQMLESRLSQVLSRSISFCRLKDSLQNREHASEPPGGLGKTQNAGA